MNPAIATIGGDARYAEAGVGFISSEIRAALLVARVSKGQSRAAAAEVMQGRISLQRPTCSSSARSCERNWTNGWARLGSCSRY